MDKVEVLIPKGDYISVRQAATLRGVEKTTVTKWVKKGWLPSVSIDGFTIINIENVRAFRPRRAGRPSEKK